MPHTRGHNLKVFKIILGCCCYYLWGYPYVTTLALGSRPKQGGCKVVGQERSPRVTFHALGSAKECEGMNLHTPKWTPCWELESQWTPKSLERNCKGQNPLAWRIIYIIGNLLKRRCLKWACIAHLDIWNTSYDQKKGRESNWQFDSWPLKVRNRPNFLRAGSVQHTVGKLLMRAITLI
jgi:hypothetical protein